MSIEARKQYLIAIRERYLNSSKKQKKAILDEFCHVCNYSRKHAIRAIKLAPGASSKRPGPKVIYDEKLILHLAKLWQAMGNMCSKKMVAALPIWLPFYRPLDFSDEQKNLLLRISSATIDRCLKKFKEQRGLSGTDKSSFKAMIPLQLLKSEELTVPGYIEADTVAHCGTSLAGQFAWSLTMTDLYSGWTENRSVWTKDGYVVMKAIQDIEESLPFFIHGFASDNGSEFINNDLFKYFKDRKDVPIEFIRRRPYKKNDNAHVEQKNWTHVRQVFGYNRLDNIRYVALMNEIYKIYWNPLLNFFTPSLKLAEKTRIGGRIKKKHSKAETPYQRLMASSTLTLTQREKLRKEFESLNPFKIRKLLDEKLKEFNRIIDTRGIKAA
jgi:hypothetical protein